MFTMEKQTVLPTAKTFGKRLYGVVSREILHPATREQGKSYCQREINRRNKAKYGKRQIRIEITDAIYSIDRDYHMPIGTRKKAEFRAVTTLEAYQSALYSSGYRLIEASPKTLIYQYEGRLH